MLLLGKRLEEITLDDLQTLIDNEINESNSIEYKSKLNINKDSNKKEFLSDVSAFSNSSGGHLIFGIEESQGIPTKIPGINVQNLDNEILRLENIIRDGLEPRVAGIKVVSVEVTKDKHVVVIEIPKSWSSPHMVTFKGQRKFYSRNSAGKYPLDVGELRIAFNETDTVIEKIKEFKIERINRIISNDSPYELKNNSTIILHIVPLGAFDPSNKVDLSKFHYYPQQLKPMSASGSDHRCNLDGFLTFNGRNTSYAQFFRNGIIESAETITLNHFDKKIIPQSFEHEIIEYVKSYLDLLEEYEVSPPFFAYLSMTGIEGYTIGYNNTIVGMDRYENQPINRDVIHTQGVYIENFDSNIADILKPMFDPFWNAAGWPKSMNYNEKGIREK